MKAIKKAENVIDENAKKGENELDQGVIVIEPGEGIELLAFSVADFLAERTAERFDRALDETELETVMLFIAQCNYRKLQSLMENVASPKRRKLQRVF